MKWMIIQLFHLTLPKLPSEEECVREVNWYNTFL